MVGKQEKRLTQLVFCDLSTPKIDGTFSVYNDIREKLLTKRSSTRRSGIYP